MPISYLLFADDIMLFCKANQNGIIAILQVLDNFCNMNGLTINLEK